MAPATQPGRVVVTGGAGFIGSAMTTALRARGDDVIVIDRRAPAPSDLCTDGVIEAVVTSDVDAVVHLAASTSVLGTLADPLGTFRVNVDATARLAEQCRRSGVTRLVFASTNAVVGAGVADGGLIDQRTTLVPLTPYGATKAAAENVLSAYRHAYGLETTVLRLTNVYGPGMLTAGKDTAIARMLKAARSGATFDVYGAGESVRDYIYIDDVVDAFLAAVDGKIPAMILPYGSGSSVSVLDLAMTVRSVTGAALPLLHLPAKEGEMPAVRVDIGLARSIGLMPRMPLRKGLALTWESPR
jgi:UDP-glucose 4-epimerase